MKIIRAEEMGMCFGVRDALKIADEVARPADVTVYGELVHNPVVNRRLSDAGFHQSGEDGRKPIVITPLVLITAHGVSDKERNQLQSNNKQLIDTTCPLVHRAHEAAADLRDEGRLVLVIGKAGHVEVQGITGDLNRYEVISTIDEVRHFQTLQLGVISQTTMPMDQVSAIHAEIQRQNPTADIRFIDTVCRPTKLRQQAMLDLLRRVDAVVAVGGMNSNNTRRLVDLCQEHGKPAYQVENAEQLQDEWFHGVKTLGLTAGTSTLDETIDEVQRVLEGMGAIVPVGVAAPSGRMRVDSNAAFVEN
ncbi:MAG: 4-hydroxy-3-methylbut-2-enyl diphosphate reductase [Rubripirellula sp.]|nr:4-hydroxy-3-methylbut-2-enyl diphosphate reductase [Rubripirellula sp.]